MYVPVQADDAVLTELVGVSLGLKVSRRCHLESSKLKHVEVVLVWRQKPETVIVMPSSFRNFESTASFKPKPKMKFSLSSMVLLSALVGITSRYHGATVRSLWIVPTLFLGNEGRLSHYTWNTSQIPPFFHMYRPLSPAPLGVRPFGFTVQRKK